VHGCPLTHILRGGHNNRLCRVGAMSKMCHTSTSCRNCCCSDLCC
jgi:hypothetical protein